MVVVIGDEAESPPILTTTEDAMHNRKNSYKNDTSTKGTSQVEIKTTKDGLDLLTAGMGQQNVQLLQQCIENLDILLDKTNVLSILIHLSKYTKENKTMISQHTPSAPPNEEADNHHLKNEIWVQELTNNLRHNCLLEIDKNANFILAQNEINYLSKEDLRDILLRDTFQVSSEILVYTTIMRYCDYNHSLNNTNKEELFTYFYHVPRYGLLTKKEFKLKKINGELGPTLFLQEKDWRKILFYIEEKSKNHVVEELPNKWSLQRVVGNEPPKILSCMSLSRANDCDTKKRKSLVKDKNNCEKVLLNFLTCWSTIFD